MKLCKLLLATAGATVLLGALVSTASANHLSSSSQSFRITWTSAESIGGFGTIKCSLTLEGSLHSRTITKTFGLLIGAINRASLGPCSEGSATILQASLPWHVQYASFTGSLPSITNIRTNLIGFSIQLREPTFGITCLSVSEAGHPATNVYSLTSGSVTSVTLGGTIPCGSFNGSLGGASHTNTAQTITLI